MYQDLIDLASELRSGTSRFRDNWEQAGNEIKNEEIEYYREQLEKAIQEASDNMSEKDKEILELSQKIDQISDEIRRLKEEREEQLSIQAMVTKYLPDEWNRLLQRIDRVQRMETAYDDRYEGVNMYGTITIIPFEGQKYTLARFLEEYKNECEKQGIEMSETLRGNYEIINNKKKEIKPISPIF